MTVSQISWLNTIVKRRGAMHVEVKWKQQRIYLQRQKPPPVKSGVAARLLPKQRTIPPKKADEVTVSPKSGRVNPPKQVQLRPPKTPGPLKVTISCNFPESLYTYKHCKHIDIYNASRYTSTWRQCDSCKSFKMNILLKNDKT